MQWCLQERLFPILYFREYGTRERSEEEMGPLLWSSVFVTLVAKKYRFMQFELDMVFDTR